MRRLSLLVLFLAALLSACGPKGPVTEGPDPVAVSIEDRRGFLIVKLENGRTCRARLPETAEGEAAGALERCPGYTYRLVREAPAFGRFLAAIAVAATDIFGTARPALGNATVTVTTPDGAVTVFRNALDEATGKHVVTLVDQRPAPTKS